MDLGASRAVDAFYSMSMSSTIILPVAELRPILAGADAYVLSTFSVDISAHMLISYFPEHSSYRVRLRVRIPLLLRIYGTLTGLISA